jgi:hypothetical protein
MLRAVLGCIAFLSLAAPTPQSSVDLRARYGEPDVQRFVIRPDITMTVEYGSDHQACILEVEPRQAFIHGLFGSQASFSKETALQLLDEVAPSELRGKDTMPLFSGYVQTSCGGFTTGLSEHAQLVMGLDLCKTPATVRSLRVTFTRPACEPLTKWNSQ